RPSLQFTGWKLETLSLGFRWSVGWCDPDEQLQRLWDAQDKHQPMRLVLGSGTWKRKWVIEEVSDSLVQTDPAGNTLSIEARVKLKDAGKSIATTEATIGLAVRNKLGIVALGKR
ncbi:MAG: phage tail protein, partial [Aquiluna sp.]